MSKEDILNTLLQAYVELAEAYIFIKRSNEAWADSRLDDLEKEVWEAQMIINNIRNEIKKGDK